MLMSAAAKSAALYLIYWYKSTNTDTCMLMSAGAESVAANATRSGMS